MEYDVNDINNLERYDKRLYNIFKKYEDQYKTIDDIKEKLETNPNEIINIDRLGRESFYKLINYIDDKYIDFYLLNVLNKIDKNINDCTYIEENYSDNIKIDPKAIDKFSKISSEYYRFRRDISQFLPIPRYYKLYKRYDSSLFTSVEYIFDKNNRYDNLYILYAMTSSFTNTFIEYCGRDVDFLKSCEEKFKKYFEEENYDLCEEIFIKWFRRLRKDVLDILYI